MVGVNSLNWKHFIILMTIYVLCSQLTLYFLLAIYVNANFSINHYRFEGELFTVNFTIYTRIPLDVKVTLIPVVEELVILPIYIFYDPKYPVPGTSWERVHMLKSNLKRELSIRNFKGDVETLTARELEDLLSKKEKAIVIFASGGFPSNVFSRNRDLVRPWLDNGGILVWFGWPPGYYTLYENQVENETFCLLPQHPFEEGVKRLGLENVVEVKPYGNACETASAPSFLGEVLDISYNLINYGALSESLPKNGLALGMIGGTPPKSSVSIIPVGKGRIILFGFFVMESYLLNGPELSARDIAQILCSGIVNVAENALPVYRRYQIPKGRQITDEIKVNIPFDSDLKGIIIYVYPTLSSVCLLYYHTFFEL